MENYRKLDKLGEGAHGVVYRAQVISPTLKKQLNMPDLVAIKKIRLRSAADGLSMEAIREIKLLQELFHPNIIKVYQVFARHANVNLVIEHMCTDLEVLLNHTGLVLRLGDIKAYTQMMLKSIAHCHANWTLHRDLKPSNCLIAADGTLKLSDFGLAKVFGSPAETRRMSPQACTLWYRAPELLFGATAYGPAADMWSIGCIFAQIMLRVPLFAGTSEIDQLSRIFAALGTPTEKEWPGVTALPGYAEYEKVERAELRTLFAAASQEAFDLLESLLTFDPCKRLTAEQALKHPYFSTGAEPTPVHLLPKLPTTKS